tara:strand:- start:23129 stop:24574 length:1446 start_codon:yes stop_codon:yes gene_type:complete
MFKKTLVALAISSVSVGAFAAADINTNTGTRTVSQQGVVNATAVQSAAITVDLGAEYAVGDILTFTFAGASLDPSTAPASIAATMTPDANDTMTLGLLDSSATSLTYRVTELTYDGANAETTIGAAVTLVADTLEFDTAELLASGSATVSYGAKTATNFNLDTPTGTKGSAEILKTADQFSAVVTTSFDETIDVEQDRLGFVGPATVDSILITPTDNIAATEYDALVTSTTYTVYGDWSILDSDADTAGVQPQVGAITIAGTGVLTSVDAEKIVFTHTNATVAAQTLTIDVDSDIAGPSGDAFNPLAQQDFTVDVSVNFTDHGTSAVAATVTAAAAGTDATLTDAEAGEWNLNGSSFTIPYMAFGANVAPIFSVTHTGTDAGEIFVEYLTEGTSTWESVEMNGLEVSPGVTNLKTEVMDAIAADILAETGATSGKVAVRVTINAPEAAISAYAAFKVSNAAGESRVAVGTFGDLGTIKNNF